MTMLYPFSFVAILANLFVLVATIKTHILQDNTGLLIGSMAVTDLLTGCFGFEFSVTMWKTDNTFTYCKIQLDLTMTFAMLSLLHMLLMNIDRYIYIIHPFKYQRFFTRRFIMVCIFCVWNFSMTTFMVPTMPGHYSNSCFYYGLGIQTTIMVLALIFLLPMLCMGLLFSRTYNAIAKHSLVINQQINSVQQSTDRTPGNRSQMKTIKMISIIMIAFSITWLPIQVINVLCIYLNIPTNIILNDILPWSMNTLFITPMLNPFIYAVFNPRYKKAILCIIQPNNRIGHHPHSC